MAITEDGKGGLHKRKQKTARLKVQREKGKKSNLVTKNAGSEPPPPERGNEECQKDFVARKNDGD